MVVRIARKGQLIIVSRVFDVLQLELQQSGKSVKEYLHDAGVNYSN